MIWRLAASFGARMSPAGAESDDDPDADADANAAVWNDQFATVDVTNDGTSSTGNNKATALSGNLVIIGQYADASASLLTESRDEIISWFFSEGFADWTGAGGVIDTGFEVIPGTPVVLPVLGGSATNLVESINQFALGIATIVSGNARVNNSTGVTLDQAFDDNGGASATADASGSGAESDANAEVGNVQTAGVTVSNNGSASSGDNEATTANGNAAIIGQGASSGASAQVNGNAGNANGGADASASATGPADE